MIRFFGYILIDLVLRVTSLFVGFGMMGISLVLGIISFIAGIIGSLIGSTVNFIEEIKGRD